MKSKYLVFLLPYLVVLMMVFSCGITVRKNFTLYKEAPQEQGTSKMLVGGIFFLKDFVWPAYYEPPYAFFLYEDGSIISYNTVHISDVPEELFWQNPEEYLKSMRLPTNEVGHYRVEDDKIVFETFAINPGAYLTGLKIIRFEGRVVNESTIVIDKVICDWCSKKADAFRNDGVLFVNKMLYQFYPTPIRPDSNSLWFKTKKWYQKNVWHNRIK